MYNRHAAALLQFLSLEGWRQKLISVHPILFPSELQIPEELLLPLKRETESNAAFFGNE